MKFATHIKYETSLAGVAIGVLAMLPLVGMPAARVVATGSTISVAVRDNMPASITVNQPDTSIYNTWNVILTGTVHNISQIMVYIDGTYDSTVPLDAGADTYTVALTLPPGQHNIKLVAIDPYTSTQIEKRLVITRDPAIRPPINNPIENTHDTATPTVSGAVNVGANKVSGVVVQAQQDVQGELNQASEAPGLLKSVADVSYQFLSSIDLVDKNDGTGLKTMGWRFVLVVTGLILAILPWSVYALAVRLHIVPMLDLHNSKVIVAIRIIGIVLLVIPFLLLL